MPHSTEAVGSFRRRRHVHDAPFAVAPGVATTLLTCGRIGCAVDGASGDETRRIRHSSARIHRVVHGRTMRRRCDKRNESAQHRFDRRMVPRIGALSSRTNPSHVTARCDSILASASRDRTKRPGTRTIRCGAAKRAAARCSPISLCHAGDPVQHRGRCRIGQRNTRNRLVGVVRGRAPSEFGVRAFQQSRT